MNCDKPVSPSVSHQVTYMLDTLKQVSTDYTQCDTIWLFMCSSLVAQIVDKHKDADSWTEVGSSLNESVEFNQGIVISSDEYVRSTSGETSVSQHVSTAARSTSREPQISSKYSSMSNSACRTLPESYFYYDLINIWFTYCSFCPFSVLCIDTLDRSILYQPELVSKPPNARLFIHLSFLKDESNN